MDLHEQIRQAIAASINDCIRNDTSFGSYADAATEAVMEVLAKQEPVAWRTFDGEGGYDYRSFADNEDYQVSWEARNPNHKGWVEPLYLTSGAQAQPAPSFADAYQGAMEEVAIWRKRALEAEELNRKFAAEINRPMYMGEPAQPAPSVPGGWTQGVCEVAAMLQKKANDYANANGYDDMGALSFGRGMEGQSKMDYYNDLIELAVEVREMLAASPEIKL